jgi:hypothetical protein
MSEWMRHRFGPLVLEVYDARDEAKGWCWLVEGSSNFQDPSDWGCSSVEEARRAAVQAARQIATQILEALKDEP